MSNVLDNDKQQQIRALGQLGWTLSRIEEATGIRRETVSGYLKAAGIAVRSRGRPSESKAKPAISEEVSTDAGQAKAATKAEVSTDSVPLRRPGRAPSASACEPYRELIAEALGRGRNAMAIWQDLVDDHGFPARYASVRRFVARQSKQTSWLSCSHVRKSSTDYADNTDANPFRNTKSLEVLPDGQGRGARAGRCFTEYRRAGVRHDQRHFRIR